MCLYQNIVISGRQRFRSTEKDFETPPKPLNHPISPLDPSKIFNRAKSVGVDPFGENQNASFGFRNNENYVPEFGGKNSEIIEEIPDLEDSYSDVEQKFSIQNEDELKYQVPIKLHSAAKNILDKISRLPKDEYGDMFYDAANIDDKWSQKLKKASEIMMYWIKKLLASNSIDEIEQVTEKMKKMAITYDKCFQVDLLPSNKSVPADLRSKYANIHSSKGFSASVRFKKRNSQLKMIPTGRRTIFGNTGSTDNLLSQVTEAVPFNFLTNAAKRERVRFYCIPKYIQNFKKQYTQSKNILISSVRTIPLKLFIKSINGYYTEKKINAKNSKVVRTQSMAEFLYDNTFNKYGIVNLTEKKLSEI